MESQKKSFRLNDRARGSVHFTEFEASELMRTLSSTRLSVFDLRSTRSASERRDVASSSGIFPPAFFYEPVITNTTMRLSVSQSSRSTTRPSSHQPHYTRPSSLEQTTKPSESLKTLSINERQTTLPRSSVSFKVTNVNKISSSSASQREEKSSNERIAQSSSIFASNVENTDGRKGIYQEQHHEFKPNKINDNYSNMNIWQSAPERPLSRSLFSVNESSQLRRSVNLKSISMEELRSVTSRVRTFPDSALNVIYRFLRALSDEVMTLALQENMTGNEDTRLWELIYKYCASHNNVDNDINCYYNPEVCKDYINNQNSSNNSSLHNNKMEVIPEFAAFREPSLSVTVEHLNTNHSDNYNNLLPAIITDNESSNKKNKENERNNVSKLNSTMDEYLSSNAISNKEENDTHLPESEEKEKECTFVTQSNAAANRFECLRNDSSEVRESVVKVNDSVVDKINYYVARQSFPIIEHNNKLQYSAEWFEPINAHTYRSTNSTIENEENENSKIDNDEESLRNESWCESDTNRARVTISAEPPLYLSGMLFDPESEKFLFNGCPFLEQARLLRVSLNVDPLGSRVATPSVRKDSAASNHGKLLVREYLTPYVSSSSSSSSTRQTKANNHQQQREEEFLSFSKEESEESEKEKERQQKEVCECKYSYLVQTFSIVPDNCPINVATHRTELIKPSEVSNILPFVYGGALTRLVILNPEAFATRTHSALTHRSFAGSMRLNSTLIQDLLQLRKSNVLGNPSSDVNDVSLSDADKNVQITPSNMTLHATVMLLTKLEEKPISTIQNEGKEDEVEEEKVKRTTLNKLLGMSTEQSNNEKSKKSEEGNKQCHITSTSYTSNLSLPCSSSSASSSLLSPPPLLSTRVGGTANVLTSTLPKKCHDSSEEQLIKLREEKITSAKQASVRNWEAEQDPVQLIQHTDTVFFCLQWYSSRCSLLLRMHATALAVRILQTFTRHTLMKKKRALHRMCRVWSELEQEAERVMRQHRPAPSSTARVEVVASIVLQEHMITTTEYKQELIEQLWQRRKRLAYAWQREFLMNTKKSNNTFSSDNENTAVEIEDSSGNRKCYSAFVQSILSSMNESERKKMEEILEELSSSSPSLLLESDNMNKRKSTKLRIAKDMIDNVKYDNQEQGNVKMESEAAIRTTNQQDTKQVHTDKDKCKSDSSHVKREVITWNTSDDKKYSDTAKAISKTVNTKHGEGYKTNPVTESTKPCQCNRSLRSCKLINSLTPDVIRDRRVADELHNLFGWYIAPEELLYESHQRLFSSLQSTVLTLEEAQMATERHLLDKLYHNKRH